MSSMKALAFMPRTMPQTRKVSLKIFLDDNDKPSGREEDVIREMQKKGLKIVGRKDFIYVNENSNISIEYNLTGPKDYKRNQKKRTSKEKKKSKKKKKIMEQRKHRIKIHSLQNVFIIRLRAFLFSDLFDYSVVHDEADAGFAPSSSEDSEVDTLEEEGKPYAETEAVMGKEGGIIDVKGFGVFLSIPMGALLKDTHIKVELFPNSTSKEVTSEHEATICPAVRCTPSGLKLKKPMTISCEHCARIAPSVKTGDTPIIVYSSKEPIDDMTLGDLAEAIETEQHMEALGRELGFSAAEINRYADTNRKGDRTTTNGTMFMLRDWRKKVGARNQLQRLPEALKKAGLVMLAETHFMKRDPYEALQDKVLVGIAEALGNDEKVAALGRALSFSTAALNRYMETNRRGDRITFKGTRDMLLDWRQKISPGDQHQKLTEALIKANLVELSDNFLSPEGNTNVDRQEIRAPNCRIKDTIIEAEVVELRAYEFRLPTESLDGKVVGYLAFLPQEMPKSREPVLNLVIYDNLPGFKKDHMRYLVVAVRANARRCVSINSASV
eukprot:XP_011672821.1 PREDICTED: uncharacterized protein LOC105442429 [Strongylocentrotus purpuratus]